MLIIIIVSVRFCPGFPLPAVPKRRIFILPSFSPLSVFLLLGIKEEINDPTLLAMEEFSLSILIFFPVSPILKIKYPPQARTRTSMVQIVIFRNLFRNFFLLFLFFFSIISFFEFCPIKDSYDEYGSFVFLTSFLIMSITKKSSATFVIS